MCLYSLYHRDANITKAKAGEPLTRGEYRQHACFLNDQGQLACIKKDSPVEIAELRLNLDPLFVKGKPVQQPRSRSVDYQQVAEWNGKKNVRGTFVQWNNDRYAADAIRLEDGTYIHMAWMDKGVRMKIVRKVRSDKGTKKPRNLSKLLGLDQIKVDVVVDDKVHSDGLI